MKNTKKTSRLGIDARFYGPIGKGLGRYTQEIVDNIIKLDQESEYVVFLRQENFSSFKSDNPRVKKVLADIRWYGLAEQLFLPFYIWRERLDLMHFPHFNVPVFCPVKFVVTIHDLILTKFPTQRATTLAPLVYKIKNFFYRIVIRRAVRRARRVLAVSAYTKAEIVRQFKIEPEKVIVTYEGVAKVFQDKISSGQAENILKKYQITKPFLLYVGNAYPHKNLESLIRAFLILYGEIKDLQLVLVGKEDYFYRRLKELAGGFKQAVIFPGYVPDNDLRSLYALGSAYIFPSLYEGFGLPALEAMALGLPVVSSDKTCLPEIFGQAAVYFNPENEKEMKEKIKQVISDQALRLKLKNRGEEQIKKYSWSECARQTLAVYKNILNNRPVN